MAKILSYDIETAPHIAYMWSLWDKLTSTDFVLEPARILCWSAKWLDNDKVFQGAEWKRGGREKMLLGLRDLLDQADITVAHNGDAFDMRWIQGEFLKEDIDPPSPSHAIDTFKIAKKQFRFPSNRLDAIAETLGIGRKIKVGFWLWKGVLAGDKEARDKMLDYNYRDVILLEDVYRWFLPWIKNHPNVANLDDRDTHACPNCGSEDLQRRGYAKTNTQTYQRYRCNNCGTWSRTRFTVRPKNTSLLTQDKG